MSEINTPTPLTGFISSFFKEFYASRRRHMSWQARIAWYVETTPELTVSQTLEALRRLRAELDMNMQAAMEREGCGSSLPKTPADFAYYNWVSMLVETMEEDFKIRLAHRAGVTVTRNLSAAVVLRRDGLAALC